MIGAVFDKVSSLFGRSFVVTGLAPVAALVMASLLTVYLTASGNPIMDRWTALKDLQLAAGLVALFAIVVAAYLLVILLPVMKRHIENRHPLWFLTARAKRNNRMRFRALQQKADEAAAALAAAGTEEQDFTSASADGALPDYPLPQAQVAEAHRLLAELRRLDRSVNDPARAKLKGLSGQYMDLRNQGAADTLDEARTLAIALWQRHAKSLQRDYDAALQRLWWRFPKLDDEHQIMATRLGNIIRSSEAHAFVCYGIDTAVIWPRLLHVMPADHAKRIEEQGTAYDFAVAMTWMAAAFALLWLGVLAWRIPDAVIASAAIPGDWWIRLGKGTLAFLAAHPGTIAAAASGAVASRAFYLAALEAARNLGRLIESSVDVYRFKLLAEMRIPMPPSLDAERQTWQRIARLIVYGEDDYLTYQKEQPKAGS